MDEVPLYREHLWTGIASLPSVCAGKWSRYTGHRELTLSRSILRAEAHRGYWKLAPDLGVWILVTQISLYGRPTGVHRS